MSTVKTQLSNPSRREWLFRLATGLACTALPVGMGTARSSETIRFGLTPVFLTNDIELLGTLRSYLSEATGFNVELVQRRTYQEVTSLLISGAIDAAWICGFPFVRNREKLALVSVPIWNAQPRYQAYVITAKERKKATLFTDLKGDIHAFSDPDSNSGYLVTRALLTDLHETPETFFSKTFFTFGHRNVVRAVASGLAGSGSVDGYIWEVMARREPELINRTKVIRKSEWLGFPPIACSRQSVSSARIKALKMAFTTMSSTPQGRAVLTLLGLDGFGVFPPSLFDGIARKVALVEAR